MKDYFLLSGKNQKNIASAFASEDNTTIELINNLQNTNVLPFSLELVNCLFEKNGIKLDSDLSEIKNIWLDYPPNNLAWPLMSEKLKNIINSELTGYEGLKWISADVKCKEDKRTYFIPIFDKQLDVLDKRKTIYVKGTDLIIKPIFDPEKIKKYSVFTSPTSVYNNGKIITSVYVKDKVKKLIERQKISGVAFS